VVDFHSASGPELRAGGYLNLELPGISFLSGMCVTRPIHIPIWNVGC